MKAFTAAGRTFRQEIKLNHLNQKVTMMQKNACIDLTIYNKKKDELEGITKDLSLEKKTLITNMWKESYDKKVDYYKHQYLNKYIPSLVTFGTTVGMNFVSMLMFGPFNSPVEMLYPIPFWVTISYSCQQVKRFMELKTAYDNKVAVDFICDIEKEKDNDTKKN